MNGLATPTVTALKRWSCQDKQPPPVDQIKAVHVYDFDNTLFASPLPNKQLWNIGTIGQLQGQDFLYNGGWWHNPEILAATGQGLAIEEPRAWAGCWNERIVELVELSMQDPDTLTILLTGRKEDGFTDLLGCMIAAKRLEFDMVCLKPTSGPNGEVFASTMQFKQALLRDVMFTYAHADDVRIYEDRIKHVKGFRDYFEELNTTLMMAKASTEPTVQRQPFATEVIHVAEQEIFLDPATEVAEVQKMINVNNKAILDGTAPKSQLPYKLKRSVFYTGYLVSPADTEKLRTLIKLPSNCAEHEVRHLANNIVITPRPAPASILNRVGGIGAKLSWKVTGLGVYDGKVWAARVQPLVQGAQYYSENPTPCVVLATRRQAKPFEAKFIHNWQPVSEQQAVQFETTVGEKVTLRIEQEVRDEDEYEATFPNARNARKHSREDDFPPLGTQRPRDGKARPQQRSGTSGGYARGGGSGGSGQRGNAGRGRGGGAGGGFRGNRGRGGGGGGGGAGGGNRGRGRGGYRSLDDNVGQGYGSGGMQY